MKKLITIMFGMILLTSFVIAETPTNVVWWEETITFVETTNKTYTFTKINATFNNKTEVFTFEPKEIYQKRFKEYVNQSTFYESTNTTVWEVVEIDADISDANYTTYVNLTFYENYAEEVDRFNARENKNITGDIVEANTFVDSTSGLGNYTIPQIITALEGVKNNPDGTLNDSSLPARWQIEIEGKTRRDLSTMLSDFIVFMRETVKKLVEHESEITEIQTETCARDNTWSWC